MAQSFEEIAREFEEKNGLAPQREERDAEPGPQAKKGSRASSFVSNVLFYSFLLFMVMMVFVYTQSTDTVRSFFGYSYYNILTTSMQNTLPQGSFILVKEVDPSTIQVGDDITFFRDANTIVTHRVIEVYEDYQDSGQYGFATQGTANYAPDAQVNFEGNIIGKVIFHVPMLGFIFTYIGEHVILFIVGFALLLALSFFLKIVFSPDEEEKTSRSAGGKKAGRGASL